MNTNYETTAAPQAPEKSNTKNIIIGVLSAAVLGLGIYSVTDHSKSGEQIMQQQTQIAKVIDEKSSIQTNFDASLARLDSMGTLNKGLEGKLTASTDEIKKVKNGRFADTEKQTPWVLKSSIEYQNEFILKNAPTCFVGWNESTCK